MEVMTVSVVVLLIMSNIGYVGGFNVGFDVDLMLLWSTTEN